MTNSTRRLQPGGTVKVQKAMDVSGPRRFSLQRLDGESAPVHLSTGRCQIGSHNLNDLVIDHPSVSRFHCEVGMDANGPWLKDLGSSNGTEVDGVGAREVLLRDGSLIKLAEAVTLSFRLLAEKSDLPLSRKDEFGVLIGGSPVMRACFAQLERAAETSRPLLIEGETGTGKTTAAEQIHANSARKLQPFITVDCSSLSAEALEETLFGVDGQRLSAFEEAGWGTLFLEEVGELSPRLQGRLMPVLEKGELRRTNSTATVAVRARLIASTRKDLRQLVNQNKFRTELFFRLAVVRVMMPPLRQRLEDIPDLVEVFLGQAGANEEEATTLRSDEFLRRLQLGSWPGNVRELYNHVERCMLMQAPLTPQETVREGLPPRVDAKRSYAEGRRVALELFEREYVEALLKAHSGKISEAARAAGMDRAYLHRLVRRHGLKTRA
ncbi:MAG: ATPase [Myxococcaceae bacterium]|nr:ATPase [Myxococcaceae bacterium]